MAAQDPPHVPPPPPVHRAPEWVGPPDPQTGRREDVSHLADRPLQLRTLNEVLELKGIVAPLLVQSNLHAARLVVVEGRRRG